MNSAIQNAAPGASEVPEKIDLKKAQLAKLADATGLGPVAARHMGSSPMLRTIFPLSVR